MKTQKYKIPVSSLIVIYTKKNDILLLHRADKKGFWQSVTGSLEKEESPYEAARREVFEETGINPNQYKLQDWNLNYEYEIYSHWRHRYSPNIYKNTEHIFGLEVPKKIAIKISPREHLEYKWFNIKDAKDKVFSWTNRKALEKLCEIKSIVS
ncbi:MAG: dihydroneopterin triphosphate diphosphatase [Nitrosomonadales bacterium]|nr:dihydroneopterin triphosphate diphosphatase [Nitrosomonadales bacterium]MBT3917765.1 dihydroneopterin triphosphate diphosphatase [Nitrosomonadales bacterium]MBT4182454.1 dihydroneopterin triphosphate diphosphatase [Nitrosomonadales bacterium]MBT4571081.1 dihydroneopterin triphosphate diphosphatase [Nitrosomonadales bacterium]MBT4759726.1 dihydroneopterin triphosphate diphosphatase [Nitrosomonadales bacterium]